MEFTEFNLHKNVLQGIEKAGFIEAMPVQEKTIVHVLEGKDVGVQSQTGSGKTAAFLIPLLQYFSVTERKDWKKALIIAPTRELVVQIENEISILGSFVDIKAGSFYGGVGYGKQDSLISKGVDVIIGTPGRLIDFGKSGKIKFKEFGFVIIDEADRLFDMGFYPDIKMMMQMMVPREKRHTMLFSATLSTRVMNLAWEYMNNPVTVEVEAESITVNEISQVLYHVSTAEKMSLLLGVLKKENPSSAIIFTNTKYAAVELTERLKVNGYDAHYIMGDLPQRKRLSVINKVKSGEVKFLVATDVAARGLHVDDLDVVVNYDIPEDFENYVHRIGRTARAGKSGRAFTFACEKFVYGLEAIEKYIDMKIPVDWPEKEMFLDDKSAGMSFYREKQAAVNSNSASGKPYDNRNRNSGRSHGQSGSRNAGSGQKERRPSGGNRVNRPSNNPSRGKLENRDRNVSRNSGKTSTPVNRKDNKNLRGRKSTVNHPGDKPDPRINKSRSPLKLTRNSTEEERLAYYRSKYGEDFKLDVSKKDSNKNSEKKKGLLKRLFGSKNSKRKKNG